MTVLCLQGSIVAGATPVIFVALTHDAGATKSGEHIGEIPRIIALEQGWKFVLKNQKMADEQRMSGIIDFQLNLVGKRSVEKGAPHV
jgi:hypothetical protein